ncbi:MAG TPA: hypothetical protein VFW09_06515 [Solirubrobacteraceae bacterium]|nr:hypothetical protein [Solirubrobacteraceae bacterium]
MTSLSEQLLALSRRADSEPGLRDALVGDAAAALAQQHVSLPDGVTARTEYHDGYGLYIELSGPALGGDAQPGSSSPPASEQATLDCLHH